MREDLRILYEDEDILVCHKSAGIATEGDRVGSPDLVSMARNYFAGKNRTKGNVTGRQRNLPPYVATINRLDKPVEGVIVLAKNKKAATELSKQIKEKSAGKYYYALCLGGPSDEKGVLEDNLIRRADTRLAAVVSDEEVNTLDGGIITLKSGEKTELIGGDVKKASLEYEVVARKGEISLLRIHLLTGRFHQIRAQLSSRSWPILGDDRYGGDESNRLSKELGIDRICLVSYRMTIKHPTSKKTMQFEITPDCGAIMEILENKD